MSNQVYIPPINFNEFDNLNSSTITKINAVEPLEYNKLNSQLSIKAASESNYGVITTGNQNIKGNKNFINGLTLTSGTISSNPSNDTDITNKNYVDSSFTNKISSADLVKYDTSTNYLINNVSNSNITDLKTDNLNISSNYINKEPNTVFVRARGAAGTFDKYITIYKSIINGRISIIFDKNLDFNSYSNVTDVSLREIIFNISDMSNISEIYDYLPNEFELTGEVSTYGGTRNIATKTLKFVKSPTDLYKYDLKYDQSFPFNIFKLKETIKNIDTVISSTEIQKINTLTIEKGYLYNTPTEDNNLVNKGYVDAIADEINNVKSELNTSINNVKAELNQNITDAIDNILIENVNLRTGTVSANPEFDVDITNKKYVDATTTKIASDLTSALNNINSVNLTTGTISTDPTNETDITNKKYVDATATTTATAIADEINTATTTLTNKIDNLKSYSDSNFIKYDSENNKLTKSSQNVDNLNISNFTVNDLQINNSLNIDPKIIEFKRFSLQTIYNSDFQALVSCVVVFFKIKIGDIFFINIKLNFSPFTSDGSTLYIKNLEISDIGASYGEYNTYLCNIGEVNYLRAARCQFCFLRNNDGTYNIEIRNTQNGDIICKFDDFECVYSVVST